MTDETRALAARLLAASPLAMKIEDALAHIAARRTVLLAKPAAKPDPDFSAPAPMPIIDAPHQFAREFLDRHSQVAAPSPPKSKKAAAKPKSRSGRSRGDTAASPSPKFTVIDGGRSGDNDT